MVSLGELPGGSFRSTASSISADGSKIVGWSPSDIGTQAFEWTESTGMVGLEMLVEGYWSLAYDISGDGSVVVGTALVPGDFEPIFWDEARNIHSLTEVLVELGLGTALEGWDLEEANAVSHDGLTIAGNGFNPAGYREAWIAYLGQGPHPVEIPALSATGLILVALALAGAAVIVLRSF